jgi:NAD(P)-dependent dehydrogenase (short-subunit alcohol dehydrogenase family)
LEWARFGIQVNGVAPGYFETEMNAQARDDDELATQILKRIPARRMGRPEELGPLVVYLASPAADFVTGETIAIDGGQLAG